MRDAGNGAGTFPSWDAVLEDVTSQYQRAAGALCRELGMDGFIAAPQLIPDPTARESLSYLGAGRQQIWLLRQV